MPHQLQDGSIAGITTVLAANWSLNSEILVTMPYRSHVWRVVLEGNGDLTFHHISPTYPTPVPATIYRFVVADDTYDRSFPWEEIRFLSHVVDGANTYQLLQDANPQPKECTADGYVFKDGQFADNNDIVCPHCFNQGVTDWFPSGE